MNEEKLLSMTKFRFRESKWEDTPWPIRRGMLTDMAQGLINDLFEKGDFRRKAKISWDSILGGRGIKMGSIIWTGPMFKEGYDSVELKFSEIIECFEKETAEDVIIHELSHLVSGTDHHDDHGIVWEMTYNDLRQKIGKPRLIDVLDSTSLTVDELSRVYSRRKINFDAYWVGECENGHCIFDFSKTNPYKKCSVCFKLNLNRPMKMSNIKWKKWR